MTFAKKFKELLILGNEHKAISLKHTKRFKRTSFFNKTAKQKKSVNFRGRLEYGATNRQLFYKQTMKGINPLHLRQVNLGPTNNNKTENGGLLQKFARCFVLSDKKVFSFFNLLCTLTIERWQ